MRDLMTTSGRPSSRTEAGHAGTSGEPIGVMDFRVACDEAVRSAFDRALGMLHHMMYVEARAMFEAIAADDPGCSMAKWGVSTTMFQPLWASRPDAAALQRGWEIVAQAETTSASERDALLIAATRAFYAEPDSAAAYSLRMDRWTRGMAVAYDAHVLRARPAPHTWLRRVRAPLEVRALPSAATIATVGIL